MQNVSQFGRAHVGVSRQKGDTSPPTDDSTKHETTEISLHSVNPENPLLETPQTERLRRDLKSTKTVVQPTRRPPLPPRAPLPTWPDIPKHQLDLATGAHKVLHASIAAGNTKAVNHYIQSLPFRLDDRDELGRTALHIAAELSAPMIVRKLLKGVQGVGADIQARNFFGLTPLHMAAASGRRDMVLLLISSGADRLAVTDYGANALDIAELHGHQFVVKTLRRLDVPVSKGWAFPPNKIATLKKFYQDAGLVPVARSLGLPPQRLEALLQRPGNIIAV